MGRRYAERNSVGCGVSDHLARVDDEDGRLSNAASLGGVVEIPGLDDSAFGVAQHWKRQREVKTQGFGLGGWVYRDSRYVCAGGLDLRVMVAVVRQLAEAESSPVAAIEEEDQGALGEQCRQVPRDASGIGELEIRSTFAGDGSRGHGLR